jgi:hypothetical protein
MRRVALATLFFPAAISLAGCTGTGAAAALPSGRTVVVNSDRSFRRVRCENSQDTSNVAIGPRTIVVGPTEVKVDGAPAATIPEQARTIAVVESDGKLYVNADGARVYEAEF